MFPWYIRAVLAVCGTIALAWGIHFFSISQSNAAPIKLSFAEYCRTKPTSEWLELDGCWVDFRYAVEIATVTARTRSTIEREYYVPIFDPNAPDQNIHAFLRCRDTGTRSDALNCIEGLLGSGYKKVSDEQRDAFFESQEGKYRRPMNVKGLVLRGLSESTEHRNLLLNAAQGHLAADFVVIDENEEPSSLSGLLLLALAAVLYLSTGLTFLLFKQPKPRATAVYLAPAYAQTPTRTTRRLSSDNATEERPPWER